MAAGCTGRAELTFTELDYLRISPEAPQFYRFAPQECYYHASGDGDLFLTMRFEQPSLFAVLRQEMLVSIRLPKASPGVSGNYLMRDAALLGVLRAGWNESRFRSYQGIVAINAHKDGSLTGGFRAGTLLVSQGLFGGWGQSRTFHLVGTFTALPNPKKGPPIDQECLAGAYDRRPTTLPVTTKAVIRLRPATMTRPSTTRSSRPTRSGTVTGVPVHSATDGR